MPIRPDRAGPTRPELPACPVVVVQRHTTGLTGSNARTELVHALSSQPAHHASPQQLGALARAHWQVEALRWVRDVTFAEDARRIRIAAGPRSWPPCATSGCSAWSVTPDRPTLGWVNRNPARTLAFLGLP
jgi:hypothetical protein